MAVDLWSAAVRSLALLAVLQAAGVAAFLAAFDGTLSASRAPIRRLGLAAAGLALIALLVFYGLEAARMAGEWRGVLDSDLRALVWQANTSALVLRVAGLLLVGVAVHRRARLTGLVGTVLIAISFAATGHAADAGVPSPTGGLVALHVFLAACWFGALLPLIVVSRSEAAAAAGAIVARFTQLATWSVPLIAVAGVAIAWRLGVGLETMGRPYGWILLAKAASFAVLMALAAANKWRLGPRLAGDPGAGAAFRRTVAVEYALIVGVLALTAWLTTFYAPEL